ncbi:hypothetical protein C5167_011792 [Papaver somniferum]|uniref:uncharacterized protein LOC113342413 n=1 Tax=Papaver somniferum TaxID=3469 RepID=UPI000E6F58BD|nr:uncharacterized protein LOC113342413 [Papaver somniferum]RZC92713.1 hypothetical protein C5167_011792 [Papaver somniferum]
MPFQTMKIQPIDSTTAKEYSSTTAAVTPASIRTDPVKLVVKSRFKRLFERQFLRNSAAEKLGDHHNNNNKDVVTNADLVEPSSVCLAKMVQCFIEESHNDSKQSQKCAGRNCFNGSNNCTTDSSDDEFEFCCGGFTDSISSSSAEASEYLKSLIQCPSIVERNLFSDTSKIVEKNKIYKPRKDDCRIIVIEGLLILGYDASICKSRWEKTHAYPAGEYEYIDVIIDGERFILDVDFRSEFEIARSTKHYRSVLQALPLIFVGKSDRLQQIVGIVSEAAKQSLKKKGMHLPPWRKVDYMKSKWISSYARITPPPMTTTSPPSPPQEVISEVAIDDNQKKDSCVIKTKNFSGEFELIFSQKVSKSESATNPESDTTTTDVTSSIPIESNSDESEKIKVVVSPWEPPAVKPKSTQKGGKIVTGLAYVLKDKP